MTPRTTRMLVMLILVAVLLNISNYIFYLFYNPPLHRAVKVSLKVKVPQTSYKLLSQTRSRVTVIIHWSDFLLCPNRSGCENAAKSTTEAPALSKSPKTLLDYHDHSASTATDSFYYYNGIRQGPVMCPVVPPGLGPLSPDQLISLDTIENLNNVLQPGGIYDELDCTPRQTVAVIIPYNGDKDQLTKFLYSIHLTLIEQQLEYRIFVIQGNEHHHVNRGRLLNAGFVEAQRLKLNGGWRCVVFHHQDLVPVDSRNLYRCYDAPAQLVAALTNNKSYEYSFGGAIAIKPRQFMKANGFSNLYVDNDAVYEDFSIRLSNANISISTRNDSVAKYLRLPSIFVKDFNRTQFQIIATNSPLHLLDGLSTLSYNISKMDMLPLYTSLELDFDESPQGYGPASSSIWDKLLSRAAERNAAKTDTGENLN